MSKLNDRDRRSESAAAGKRRGPKLLRTAKFWPKFSPKLSDLSGQWPLNAESAGTCEACAVEQ